MRNHDFPKRLVVVCSAVILIAACKSAPPPSAQGQHQTAAPSQTAKQKAAGSLWHSLTSKKNYRVEIYGNTLVTDMVDVPLGVPPGTSTHTVCHLTQGKWVGVSTVTMAIVKQKGNVGHVDHMCSFTLPFEIDSISKDKIKGRGATFLNGKQFNAITCKVGKTKWAPFVWVRVE